MAKQFPNGRSKTGAARGGEIGFSPAIIMVVYDDMIAGLGTQVTLNRIAEKVGDRALDIRFWDYEFVVHPQLRDQARRDVEEADLIVFSMIDSTTLPVRLINWINHWRGALKPGETSFALMSGAGCREDSLVRLADRFLKDFARRRRTDYFFGVLPDFGPDPRSRAEGGT